MNLYKLLEVIVSSCLFLTENIHEEFFLLPGPIQKQKGSQDDDGGDHLGQLHLQRISNGPKEGTFQILVLNSDIRYKRKNLFQ